MSDVLIFLVLMGSLASIAFGIVLFFSRLAVVLDARRSAAFRAESLLAIARSGVRS